MPVEIELKAWVEEFDTIKERLDTLYGPPGRVQKEDIYYTTDEKADADQIRPELLAVLDAAGVPRARIEERYYMDMLTSGA